MKHPIFYVTVLLVIVGLVQAQDCALASDFNVDCGYSGITQAECEGKNCCFDSTIPESKWCLYKPAEAPAKKAECTVDPSIRIECGDPGITDKDCRGSNCCYDESIPDVTWCFQKAAPTTGRLYTLFFSLFPV
ncbi:integumentary mucin A.1-like [Xenopus laevis]|uniref:Integumentary mucin A.1-like n=1 Tax=Xenopus laevis TaxID=8355 RepID=A0A8J1M7Y2_XENLA|nr:integumentary mucin A.1-like [Xenopus laevis]